MRGDMMPLLLLLAIILCALVGVVAALVTLRLSRRQTVAPQEDPPPESPLAPLEENPASFTASRIREKEEWVARYLAASQLRAGRVSPEELEAVAKTTPYLEMARDIVSFVLHGV